jgi:hypothetical protein
VPLAHPDDVILYVAESNPRRARVIDRARVYVQSGHIPQLRMALAPTDTLNDYLAALDSPTVMQQLRRRAAGAHFDSGFVFPDLPYLALIRSQTIDGAPAYREASPVQQTLELDAREADRPPRADDGYEEDQPPADRAFTPMRGPGRQR